MGAFIFLLFIAAGFGVVRKFPAVYIKINDVFERHIND